MIGAGRRDYVLFYHRAAKIVRSVVQSLPADVQPLREPGCLHVRNVIEIEAPDRKPSEVFIARDAIGKALADRRVVGLKSPRNKRHEPGIAILQLTQAFEMHQPVIASLAHAKHHGRRSRDSEGMRHVHHVQPLFCVAMSSPLPSNLVDENFAASAWYRVKPCGAKLPQQSFNSETRDLCKMIELRR